MNDSFTLLKRITRVKIVNAEIKSRIQIPTWKGIPRRVHATMRNPAWVTHLLRTIIANSDVECISRAKTLQLYLTGMGRWKDPRKYHGVTIAIACARWNEFGADASIVKWEMQIATTAQQKWETLKTGKDRHAGSGLSRSPLTKVGKIDSERSTCRFWA